MAHMRQQGVMPDATSFSLLLRACLQAGDLRTPYLLFTKARTWGPTAFLRFLPLDTRVLGDLYVMAHQQGNESAAATLRSELMRRDMVQYEAARRRAAEGLGLSQGEAQSRHQQRGQQQRGQGQRAQRQEGARERDGSGGSGGGGGRGAARRLRERLSGDDGGAAPATVVPAAAAAPPGSGEADADSAADAGDAPVSPQAAFMALATGGEPSLGALADAAAEAGALNGGRGAAAGVGQQQEQ
jgi:hypothetical protein